MKVGKFLLVATIVLWVAAAALMPLGFGVSVALFSLGVITLTGGIWKTL